MSHALKRLCSDYWTAASRQNWQTFLVFIACFFVVSAITIPISVVQLIVNAAGAVLFSAILSYGIGALGCALYVMQRAKSAAVPLADFVGTIAYRDAIADYVKQGTTEWW